MYVKGRDYFPESVTAKNTSNEYSFLQLHQSLYEADAYQIQSIYTYDNLVSSLLSNNYLQCAVYNNKSYYSVEMGWDDKTNNNNVLKFIIPTSTSFSTKSEIDCNIACGIASDTSTKYNAIGNLNLFIPQLDLKYKDETPDFTYSITKTDVNKIRIDFNISSPNDNMTPISGEFLIQSNLLSSADGTKKYNISFTNSIIEQSSYNSFEITCQFNSPYLYNKQIGDIIDNSSLQVTLKTIDFDDTSLIKTDILDVSLDNEEIQRYSDIQYLISDRYRAVKLRTNEIYQGNSDSIGKMSFSINDIHMTPFLKDENNNNIHLNTTQIERNIPQSENKYSYAGNKYGTYSENGFVRILY